MSDMQLDEMWIENIWNMKDASDEEDKKTKYNNACVECLSNRLKHTGRERSLRKWRLHRDISCYRIVPIE